jgi:thymidylate synthase (FAD)
MSNPTVFITSQGTRYLKEPGVVLLSKPSVDLSGMTDFLDDLDFGDYLNDPIDLPSGAQLCKTAGQLCYMSFGEKRTKNIDAEKYFNNILSSSHGSVLEHANYSFLLYGISRSLTHELITHRLLSKSQVSQRYISGKMLRFVERPEYQNNEVLHLMFEKRINQAIWEYLTIATLLAERQEAGEAILSAEAKTDLRKKINQAARSCLPNETEAPTIVTTNIRAWRHIIEARASEHAETEIRAVAMKVFYLLQATEPILFADYDVVYLADGTEAVRTKYRKV